MREREKKSVRKIYFSLFWLTIKYKHKKIIVHQKTKTLLQPIFINQILLKKKYRNKRKYE